VVRFTVRDGENIRHIEYEKDTPGDAISLATSFGMVHTENRPDTPSEWQKTTVYPPHVVLKAEITPHGPKREPGASLIEAPTQP
jgi:hypothetical protein